MAITGAGIVGRSDLLRVDPRVIQTEEGWNPRADFGDIDAIAATALIPRWSVKE